MRLSLRSATAPCRERGGSIVSISGTGLVVCAVGRRHTLGVIFHDAK